MMKLGKFLPSVLIVALLTLLLAPLAQAEETTIIAFKANQQALLESKFTKKIMATSEWKLCYSALTSACDFALTRELAPEKWEGKLPKPLVDALSEQVAKGISTRKLIDKYARFVEAVVFELRGDGDKLGECTADLSEVLRGKGGDIDCNFNGFLAFVLNTDPSNGLKILQYLKEGKDYSYIRNGDEVIVKFTLKYKKHSIEFCVAGTKLKGQDRYVVLLSDKKRIEQRLNEFKTGRYSEWDYTKPVKELTLDKSFFLFAAQQRQLAGLNAIAAEFLSKVSQMQIVYREVDDAPMFGVETNWNNVDDAEKVRTVLTSLLIMSQVDKAKNKPWAEALRKTKIQREDKRVAVLFNLDNPATLKILSDGLDLLRMRIEAR